MTLQEIAAPDVVSFDDLKRLASAKWPCITVIMPLPNPIEIRTRLKNAIRAIEQNLKDLGTDGNTAAVLLEPVRAMAIAIEVDRKWANTLILFRSAEIFRHYWLRQLRQEVVTV